MTADVSQYREAPLRWGRITTVILAAWGVLHVFGGAALVFAAAFDPAEAMRSLGSGAAGSALPADAGGVTQALVGFHGLNILFAGLAVVGLCAARSWRQWPAGIPTSLVIASAADVGLIADLLVPGYMRIADGLWGPLLLVLALGAYLLARSGSRQTSPGATL